LAPTPAPQAATFHKTSIDNLLHPRSAGANPYKIVLGEVRQRLMATRRRMEELLAGHTPDADAGVCVMSPAVYGLG
jgi:phosphoenolpyruvate carboxylase